MAELKRKQKVLTGLAASDGGASSRLRTWQFRVLAVCLPFFVLGLLEVALRVGGYGYRTGFFVKSKLGGREVLRENEEFARRYFPPGLERTPQTLAFAAEKGEGNYRIFVFGESAAMGDPAPAYGFARILAVLLEARYAGQKFEVINLAVTAINSHVILQIARDCARVEGDVWLIYMGNNEVVGPFGAGTVFGAQVPSLGAIRLSLGLKRSRIGQLADGLKYWVRGGAGEKEWGGMEMFLEQQVGRDDVRMGSVYDHYRRNLEEILTVGEKAGVKLVIGTVVSNLKDCPPFGSLHRPDLGDPELGEWKRFYEAGKSAEEAGDWESAREQYDQAAKIDGSYAELHFRRGRCDVALNRVKEARRNFTLARDLDTLRFRADGRIGEMIRQEAAEWEAAGVELVDLEKLFEGREGELIAGEDVFYEHVHFNFKGNYEVARAFAEQIAGLLPARIVRSVAQVPPLLSMAECAERLALTGWDRHRVMEEMARRLQEPPFANQLDHEKREARYDRELGELRKGSEGSAGEEGVRRYEAALKGAEGDWVLHENFARYLQGTGRLEPAEAEWRKLIELLPHYAPGYYGMGNNLDLRGRSAEALIMFREALRLRPRSVEARNGLGLALANLGRFEEAKRILEEAIELRPQAVEARINLGQLQAGSGELAGAREQYTRVLAIASNNVAAHVNLGKLEAQEGRVEEAIGHYREAVRLEPGHAVAHYNLGNALTGLGDGEALIHYAEAVRVQPDFVEARYNLGLGLAGVGRAREAMVELQEVVRLKPGFAEGHLNFGVALAKEQRYAEAIREFEEALRLDPGNEMSVQFLEQAKTRLGRGAE